MLTDVNGYFSSGQILNDDGPGEDGLDIVAIVFTANSAAEVVDSSENPYYNLSNVFQNCPDGTLNVGENLNATGPTQDGRGAWIIFSLRNGLTGGYYYLSSTVSYSTPLVTCRWPHGDYPLYWTNGTIDLPNWACWWPDIILHEYAHHVMKCCYGYLPNTIQEHYMTQKSNSTTAWTEGWANFFPLAAFNKPTFVLGVNATHGISYNLETPTWYTSGWDDGDEVEGRVAGALWDIFDSQNDNAPWYYDSFSDGFTRIWNVMSGAPRNTFREFWQAWNITYYARQQTLLAIFQNTIDYRGPGDVNADCYVGMDDIYMIAYHFGRQIGDPDWDVRRDLNMDGYIGIDDIFIASSNYGNQY